jgi:hypothetical protein
MPTTDWFFPSTATNQDRSGSVAWSSGTLSFALTDDENFAQCTPGAGNFTDWLQLTDYGFDGAGGVPVGTSIDGIEVAINRYYGPEVDPMRDSSLRLVKSGPTMVGDDKADTGADWPNGSGNQAEVSYGSSSDNWSAGLTAADVRNSGFGVRLSVLDTAASDNTARVDYMKIRITYSFESDIIGAAGGFSPSMVR